MSAAGLWLDAADTRTAAARVHDILERCQTLVTPALHAAVDRLHPRVGLAAAFSLGWCDADGSPAEGSTGKGLRPALAVLSAQAAGASPRAATAAAVAVELVHAFTLVHDDIMDGDERRRHRPSVWRAFGTGSAVLAGDALLALAVDVLSDAARPCAAASARVLSGTLVELVNGQAEDLSFEERPWTGPDAVGVEEYTAMSRRKTGSLLGCASALGALSADAPAPSVDAMTMAGRHLGLAFQAVDDLLGIWGDPAVTGKPVFSDLRRRKKTLPVLFALSGTRERPERTAELLDLLTAAHGDRSQEADLTRAAMLITEAGGQAFTTARARVHAARAGRIVAMTATDGDAAAEIAGLAEFMVTRSH